VKPLKRLDAAVVDSSPFMSMFEERDSMKAFKEGLKKSAILYMSSATLIELSVVFTGAKGAAGPILLDEMLAKYKVKIEPLDSTMIEHARHGCLNYGKGHNPASLNMGDLFSYSLAKKMDLPLFYEGMDFLRTDIKDAMAMLGYEFDAKHTPRIPQIFSQ
jgi:ribonuclease VapC